MDVEDGEILAALNGNKETVSVQQRDCSQGRIPDSARERRDPSEVNHTSPVECERGQGGYRRVRSWSSDSFRTKTA
jgi:hypothetical protein